jgi:arylsulfatase A-like enzyme
MHTRRGSLPRLVASLALSLLAPSACSHAAPAPAANPAGRARVILFVWDGLRPDAITRTETPHLYALRESGTRFDDHHSVYPTFTMVNAAAFATGDFPAETGFHGNYLFQPGPAGKDTSGKPVEFSRQVIFTEDYGVLRSLDQNLGGRLLLRPTLFELAQKSGLTTATLGKSGPAFLQDYKSGGMIVDEKVILPASLGQEVRATAAEKWPLEAEPLQKLPDGVTPDPAAKTSRHAKANAVLVDAYLDHVLPRHPDLTVLWLRDPDSTEHVYGPGSPAYHDALARQDQLLGRLLERLGSEPVDLIVASDHGHTSIASLLVPGGPSMNPSQIGPGEVRLAHLLHEAGIDARDGVGCIYSPVLSPVPVKESDGVCPGMPRYSTPAYPIPAQLGPGAVVVAANGGSDYAYVPSHDAKVVSQIVAALQKRPEIAAIFVASRYGELAGTVPLSAIRAEDPTGRHPDVVVDYAADETTSVQCVPGIEFAGSAASRYRGMHGTLGASDVHAVLIARGPHFRAGWRDPLPTSNVDVAPTIAALLGFDLPQRDGRPLLEALAQGGAATSAYTVEATAVAPREKAQQFDFAIYEKVLRRGDASYTYIDGVRTTRR